MQFSIEADGAGVGLGAIGETFDGADVVVEELGVELDAFVGIDAGLADFFDLGFGENVVLLSLRAGARRSDCGCDEKG